MTEETWWPTRSPRQRRRRLRVGIVLAAASILGALVVTLFVDSLLLFSLFTTFAIQGCVDAWDTWRTRVVTNDDGIRVVTFFGTQVIPWEAVVEVRLQAPKVWADRLVIVKRDRSVVELPGITDAGLIERWRRQVSSPSASGPGRRTAGSP